MAAAGLERARGALAALEAALAEEEEEEEGEVPARVLVEHRVDTRRKQKLLLAQLRVLRQLLGVLEHPQLPRAPPGRRAAGSQARGRWRGLKGGYGGAVVALGGALPPALAQLGRGRRLRGALGARLRQKEELEAKLREAEGRREQLRRGLEAQRGERRGRQGALRRQEGAVRRAGAGCRLYQRLTGVGGPPLPPGSSELRPGGGPLPPPLMELPVGPPQ